MKTKNKQSEEFNKWWEENIADRYDQIQKRRVKVYLKSQRTQILGEVAGEIERSKTIKVDDDGRTVLISKPDLLDKIKNYGKRKKS